MSAVRWLAAVLVLFPLSAFGCGSSESDSGPSSVGGSGGQTGNPLVSGLAISEISINQSVKVALFAGGKLVEPRNAPIVQGRRALVRVSVQAQPGWQPREVVARLELATAAGPLPPQEVKSPVLATSNEADLKTTFNFDLPGSTVTGDLVWAVSLHEANGQYLGPPSPGAAFPDPGSQVWLGAESNGEALKMVIVPFNYNADGSGRLPDLGEEQLAKYQSALERVFPAAKVEIRIHDPIPWDQPLAAGGGGWSELLQHLLFRRQQDRFSEAAAANEFYYGLISPAVGFISYCSGGGGQCLLGLTAGIDDPAEEYGRGSVGAGFTGDRSANTMAHETGHAHGRLHAPCAPGGAIQGIDPGYPYPDGELGTWGYDQSDAKLYDPNGDARDIMGYCDPRWVSDYTFKALFTRMAFVNASADLVSYPFGEPKQYRSYSIDGAGELALGRSVSLRVEPRGEPRRVELLDHTGALRRRVSGHFYPHSDLPGGFLLAPEPEPGDFVVRVISKNGQTAVLAL